MIRSEDAFTPFQGAALERFRCSEAPSVCEKDSQIADGNERVRMIRSEDAFTPFQGAAIEWLGCVEVSTGTE